MTIISLENIKKKKTYWNRSSILVFIYGLILPVEDFLFQDIIGSSSRIVAVVIFFDYLVRKGFPSFKYVSKYAVYYCIIILLSLIWSKYPDFQGVFRLFVLLFSSVIFAALHKEDENTILKFLAGFTLSGCFLGIKTLLEFTTSGVVERVTIEEMNNNSLANSIGITALYIIFLLLNKRINKFYYPVFIGLLLINLGGIIATGSRGSMLAFIICLIFYFRSFVSKYILIGFALFILLVPLIREFNEIDPFIELIFNRTEKSQEDHGGNRIPIWKAGISMFYDYPITGVGFRNFRFLSPDYAQKSKLLTTDEYYNFFDQIADTYPAHNNYLDTLCELGIIGFLIFITWLVQCYIGCYYQTSIDGKIVMILLTFLLVTCFFGDLYNLKIFWVVTGIAGYYHYTYRNRNFI